MHKILSAFSLLVAALFSSTAYAQMPLVAEPQSETHNSSFIPLVGQAPADKREVLRNQALDFFNNQEYDKSADTLSELIAYLQQSGDPADELLDTMMLYASTLGLAGRNQELYNISSALYDIFPTPEIIPQEYWDIVIHNAITSSIALGGTPRTEEFIEAACKHMDKSSDDYFDMLSDAFGYYLEMGNIAKLREMTLPVIAHVERHPEDVEMLAEFVPFYYKTYSSDGALVRFRNILEKAMRPGSVKVNMMLYQIYMADGDYDAAKKQISLIDDYVKKASKALDKGDLSSFDDIMTLINANNALGRFEDNIALHDKLDKAILQTRNLDKKMKEELRISILPVKAACYIFSGRFDEAREIYSYLLANINEDSTQLDKTDLIMGLEYAYEKSGDYDRAINLLGESLRDVKNEKDRMHIVKGMISPLVEWLDSSYDHNSPLWKSTLSMLDGVIADLEDKKQKGRTDVDTDLSIIGAKMSAAYFKNDLPALAEIAATLPPYFKERKMSSEHRRYAIELYTMASVLSGDNVQAEQNLEMLNGLALSHEEKLYNNMLLAEVAARKGDMNKAREAYSTLTSDIVADLSDNLSRMTAEERSNYFRKFANVLTNAGRMAKFGEQDKYAGEVYDLALFYKDFLLNSDKAINRIINKSGNVAAIGLQADINRLQHELSNELPNSKRGENLRKEINALQHKLWEMVPESKAFFDEMKADWKSVQQALGPEDTAIEFLEWTPVAAPREYGAVVLKKNMKYPMVIRLGNAEEIEKEISDSRKADKIWIPLFAMMDSKGKTFFSGAGMINVFPIETLMIESEGRDVPIDSKYPLYRLSSTRRLLETRTPESGRLLLFGDIDYNNTDEIGGNMADNSDSDTYTVKSDGAIERKIGKKIYSLPGSKRELDNVISSFESSGRKSGFNDYKAYRRELASTGNFKNLSGTDAVGMLVSTHGYYLNGKSGKDVDAMAILSQDLNRRLQNSGLVMAGFNQYAKQKGEGIKKALVSAYDVSMLDLNSVDLAVLSACETGLGDTDATDSFGLQRGFKMAGVNTMLVTTAKVSDEAAEIMVSEFFKGLMDGKKKQDAFREAREKLRRQYPDPRYWTPFILIDAL